MGKIRIENTVYMIFFFLSLDIYYAHMIICQEKLAEATEATLPCDGDGGVVVGAEGVGGARRGDVGPSSREVEGGGQLHEADVVLAGGRGVVVLVHDHPRDGEPPGGRGLVGS